MGTEHLREDVFFTLDLTFSSQNTSAEKCSIKAANRPIKIFVNEVEAQCQITDNSIAKW